MKTRTGIALLTALGAAGWAGAAEYGRVISSTPVTQQVAVPQQVCSVEQGSGYRSGGGALLGALIGGGIANAISHGSGQVIATGLGLVAGAAIGDNIEGNQARATQHCHTVTSYENRAVGYNVVYEYAGRRYTVQTAADPGAYIPVQVTPVGVAPAPDAYAAGDYPPAQAPGYGYPPAYPTVVTQPVYPAVYARPYRHHYAPPVTTSINFGYVYRDGGRHRHWR